MGKIALTILILSGILTLSQCGGNDEPNGPPNGPTSEAGVRIHLGSASTVFGDVYGGPVPTDPDVWPIAESPEAHGFEHLGSLGSTSPNVNELTGSGHYQYVLIKVHYGAVSTSSTSYLRLDAIQRLSDGMYLTGRTNAGYMFYSTNWFNENRPFLPADPADPDYAVGAPDGNCVRLYGWALLPLIDWAQ